MLRVIIAAAVAAVLGASGAQANVSDFKVKDEIAGTEVRYVTLKSSHYQSITNEDEITFRCEPYKGVGIILIEWHRGGRHSGYMIEDLIYKVDDEPPVEFNVVTGSAAQIIGDFSRGSRAVIKPLYERAVTVVPTVSFSLRGSAAAFKTFDGQCALD